MLHPSRPTRDLLIVGIIAVVAECCEDPWFRSDLASVPLWHRALMLAAGASCVAIYHDERQRKNFTKAGAMGFYFVACTCIALISHLRLAVR